MDIISYGIANKTKASEAKLRNQTLASGVEGKSKNVKERIDSLEKYFDGLTARANKLIVNDAVNIMKANARLNAVAKTTKYRMENMIFDDLLDASGIDAGKSSGHTHNTELGYIQSNSALSCTIETVAETLQSSPEKVILLAEKDQKKASGKPRYGIKFDGAKTRFEMRDWTSWTTKEFTCELTVKLNSTKNQAFVAYNEDRIICGYYGDKVHLRLVNTTIDGIALQTGKEYKLRYVIAYTGGKSYLRIYVDGQLVASGESGSVIPAVSKYWSIGQEVDGGYYSDYASGVLSDIRLWSIITDTAGTELSGKEAGLELYYDFSEGTGAVAIDKSPNKRDFTIMYGEYVQIGESEEPAPTEDPSYFISRDNGETWIPIVPEKLLYFDNGTVPEGTQLKLKAIIPAGYKLSNYALTWA